MSTCLSSIRRFLYKNSKFGNQYKWSHKSRGTLGQHSLKYTEELKKYIIGKDWENRNKEIRLFGVIRSSVVRFWIIVSAFEAATDWNRGISGKMLKLTNKMLFFCLLNHDFHQWIKQVIKGKNFVNFRENTFWTLRQLRTETGESLAKFSNH